MLVLSRFKVHGCVITGFQIVLAKFHQWSMIYIYNKRRSLGMYHCKMAILKWFCRSRSGSFLHFVKGPPKYFGFFAIIWILNKFSPVLSEWAVDSFVDDWTILRIVLEIDSDLSVKTMYGIKGKWKTKLRSDYICVSNSYNIGDSNGHKPHLFYCQLW